MRKFQFLLLTFVLLFSSAFPVFSATSGSFYSGSGGTGEKPQSKAWFNDGTWWTILLDGDDSYFYKLENGSFVKQLFPDAKVHPKNSARADTLSNGEHLFALMRHRTDPQLFKYTYDVVTQAYTLLPGFPIDLPLESGHETAVIAQDGTGTVWIAYEAGGKIHVVWSLTGDHLTWDFTGEMLHIGVNDDDIASIVTFGNAVGVFWSNQNEDHLAFRFHVDGDPYTTWSPIEIVVQGSGSADDHINLAVTPSGDVLAAIKPFGDLYFVRRTDLGWQGLSFVNASGTRPIVIYDKDNNDAYFLYTEWNVTPDIIVYRRANLDDLVWSDPVELMSPTNNDLDNVTSTKEAVDISTGLLALTEGGDQTYYALIDLTPGPGQPIVNASVDVTTGLVPLDVQFTATASVQGGTIISYLWDFGDGDGSSAQNPLHTYPTVGSFLAQVTVTDDLGTTATDSLQITVTTPPINLTASADQTNGPAPLDVQFTATASVAGGTIVAYLWDFGDTTGSSAQNPLHTYASIGTYVAQVTVTDDLGTTASDSLQITTTTDPSSDVTAPSLTGHNPAPGAVDVPIDTTITVQLSDTETGVDSSSITMLIDGLLVTPTLSGSPAQYTLTYTFPGSLGYSQTVTMQLQAQDFALPPNPVSQTYSFTTVAAPTYIAQINFQPSGAAVPSGYLPDSGALFDPDLGYGWTLTLKSKERETNPDQRLDTYVYVVNDAGAADWNYVLPNGDYLISLVAGGPEWSSINTVALEGTVVIDAVPTSGGESVSVIDFPVTVADGQFTLTIGGSGDSKKTKLCYLTIKPANS